MQTCVHQGWSCAWRSVTPRRVQLVKHFRNPNGVLIIIYQVSVQGVNREKFCCRVIVGTPAINAPWKFKLGCEILFFPPRGRPQQLIPLSFAKPLVPSPSYRWFLEISSSINTLINTGKAILYTIAFPAGTRQRCSSLSLILSCICSMLLSKTRYLRFS